MVPLWKFLHNYYSQAGEDGIILEICRRLHISYGYFIDIGAGDCGELSNTRHLILEGWAGVLIEADEEKHKRCIEVAGSIVKSICAKVTAENVNELITGHPIDFCSIDIDGNDYWIWKALKDKPKIICIEYNPQIWDYGKAVTIAYEPGFKWDGSAYYGASARALYDLGRSMGYTLVWATNVNMIFVLDEYAELFAPYKIEYVPLFSPYPLSERKMVEVQDG